MEHVKVKDFPKNNFKLIIEGHRGAGLIEPDNSIKAFKRAIQLGLEGVELDVWLSKDKVPIVLHGLTNTGEVETKNKGTIKINEIDSTELDSIILKNDETIPTLEEMLEVCKGKLYMNIEFKQPDEELMFLVIEMIKKKEMLDQIEISSFRHQNREFLHKALKTLKIDQKVNFGFLMAIDKWWEFEFSKDLEGDAINLDYRMLLQREEETLELIKKSKENGMIVKFWFTHETPENDEVFQRLIDIGCDVNITNYPLELLKFLNKLKEKGESKK